MLFCRYFYCSPSIDFTLLAAKEIKVNIQHFNLMEQKSWKLVCLETGKLPTVLLSRWSWWERNITSIISFASNINSLHCDCVWSQLWFTYVQQNEVSIYLVALLCDHILASQFSEVGCYSYQVHLIVKNWLTSVHEKSSLCKMDVLRNHCYSKLKLFCKRHAGDKGERSCRPYSFLTSTLDWGEWSAPRPGRALSPGKHPGTHWIGSWVGLRAVLDTGARGKILCLC
jgi:hypothetical protein